MKGIVFLRFSELNILCNLYHIYTGLVAAQPVIQWDCSVLYLPGAKRPTGEGDCSYPYRAKVNNA
jgi:hypothetical protein